MMSVPPSIGRSAHAYYLLTLRWPGSSRPGLKSYIVELADEQVPMFLIELDARGHVLDSIQRLEYLVDVNTDSYPDPDEFFRHMIDAPPQPEQIDS